MPKASKEILNKFKEDIEFLNDKYILEDVIIYTTGWEEDDNYKSLLPIYKSTNDQIIFKPVKGENEVEKEIKHWLAHNKSLNHKVFANGGCQMKTEAQKIEQSKIIINEEQESYDIYIALPYVGKSLEYRLKESNSIEAFELMSNVVYGDWNIGVDPYSIRL